MKSDIDRLRQAIPEAMESDAFWKILIDESYAQSGPFDGGCLICAKAMALAVIGSDLVRITSKANGGQTEHYGIRCEGRIFDMAGECTGQHEWIDRFKKAEMITDRELGFAVGFDPMTDTPDDPRASKRISQILLACM